MSGGAMLTCITDPMGALPTARFSDGTIVTLPREWTITQLDRDRWALRSGDIDGRAVAVSFNMLLTDFLAVYRHLEGK